MVTRIIALTLLAFGSQVASGPLHTPPPPPDAADAAPPRVTLAGTLVDARGNPVEGALVVACDADSGMPLCGGNWEPLGSMLDRDGQQALVQMQFRHTGADGSFAFEDVPKRGVKLIAQHWDTDSPIGAPLEVNGANVTLAASQIVSAQAISTEPVRLQARGNSMLSIHCDSGNNETLVIVSASPTIADPILGFAGWQGAFTRDAIAWNRAPLGETTFAGLPPGTVFITIFSADNNPGFGQAEVELRDGWLAEVEIPWVASWSNGLHLPPESIATVQEQLRRHDLLSAPRWMNYLQEQGIELARPDHPLRALTTDATVLETRVDLPDNAGSVRVGDALAAVAYAGMKDMLSSQGRTPNPHRDPVVKMHPPPADDAATDPEHAP